MLSDDSKTHKQWTEDWNRRFLSGDTPWEESQPTALIESLLKSYAPAPCRVLEVGCGLGTNAIHLAKLGHEVFAVDVAEKAIVQARKRAVSAGISVAFFAQDFLSNNFMPPNDLACIVDKGCMHSFCSAAGRLAFVERVAFMLPSGGLWINISGSADNDDAAVAGQQGFPRLTAREIISATEGKFRLLELRRCFYGESGDAHFLAWAGVFQRL